MLQSFKFSTSDRHSFLIRGIVADPQVHFRYRLDTDDMGSAQLLEQNVAGHLQKISFWVRYVSEIFQPGDPAISLLHNVIDFKTRNRTSPEPGADITLPR